MRELIPSIILLLSGSAFAIQFKGKFVFPGSVTSIDIQSEAITDAQVSPIADIKQSKVKDLPTDLSDIRVSTGTNAAGIAGNDVELAQVGVDTATLKTEVDGKVAKTGDTMGGVLRVEADAVIGFGLDKTTMTSTGEIQSGGSGDSHFLGKLGIGTTDTSDGILNIEGTGLGLVIKRFSDAVGGAPQMRTFRFRGTRTSSAALGKFDLLSRWRSRGWDGASADEGTAVNSWTSEAWDGSSHGAFYEIRTTPNGTVTMVNRIMVDHDGQTGIGPFSGFSPPLAQLHVANVSGDLVRISTSVTGGESFIIKNNGFIGIGTSPGAKLHVSNGPVLIDGTNASLTVTGGSITANSGFIDTRLSIGTTVQTAPLTIVSEVTSQMVIYTRHADTAGATAGVIYQRSRGTINAPTASQSGDRIGRTAFSAHDGTDFEVGATFRGLAAETWTGSNKGMNFVWLNQANGTTSLLEKMRLTSEGELAIGTSSPSEQLDVAQNAIVGGSMTASAFFGDGAGLTGITDGDKVSKTGDSMTGPLTMIGSSITIAGADAELSSGTLLIHGNAAIPFQIGASTFIVRGDNGFVGIGTNDPKELVHVTETDSGSQGGARFILERKDTSVSSGVNIGALLFNGSEAGNNRTVASIRIQSDASWTGPTSPSNMQFHTTDPTDDDDTERMRIDSSGNIGINTSTPTAKLEILAASGIVLTVSSGTDSSQKLWDFLANGDLLPGTSGQQNIGSPSAPVGEIFVSENSINFVDSSGVVTSSLSISGSGALQFRGINVANSSGNLDIASSELPADGYASTYVNAAGDTMTGDLFVNAEGKGFIVDALGNKRVGFMKYSGVQGAFVHGNTVPLAFGQVNQADVTGGTFSTQMLLDTSGRLGVGITNPVRNLHLFSTGDSRLAIDGGTANLASLDFRKAGVDEWALFMPASSDRLDFLEQAGGTRLTLQAGGNIGVGTTNPSQKLEIFDGNMELDITASGTDSNTDSGYIQFFSRGNAGGTPRDQQWRVFSQHVGNVGKGDLVFLESSDGESFKQRLTLAADGEVGIGTTDPTIDLAIGDTDSGLSGSAGVLDITANGTVAAGARTDGTNIRFFVFGVDDTTAENPVCREASGELTRSSTGCGTSSRRYKQNIQDLDYGLKEVMRLRPVTYQKKNNPDRTQFGMIAEEVAKVFPEIIGYATHDPNRIENYDIRTMHAVLIKAMQEQQKQIEELKNKLMLLKEQD